MLRMPIIVIVVVFVAVFYFTGHLNKASGATDMLNSLTLIAVIILFIYTFGLVFILSLHPKTRKIADRLFGFIDKTDLENLKGKAESTDKELKQIKTRLKSIETTLKTLTSKRNKKGKE